jgi:hypothetical protein
LEKRSCERFRVPGATLCYRKKGWFFVNGGFGEDFYPVLDISRGGVKFLCNHRLKAGSSVVLRLAVPGLEEEIEILGSIRWTNRNPEKSYRYQVGIAFHPYGSGKNENSPQILETLRRIEAEHIGPTGQKQAASG